MKNGKPLKATVAVVSYNSLDNFHITKDYVDDVLVLSDTFSPKCPDNVLMSDSNWQCLLEQKDYLEKVILFAGKKSSGALEIIHLAAESFADKRECLLFVLCDHDLDEKIKLVESLGFHDMQYMYFKDGHTRCQELPLLRAYAYDYLVHHQ
jgi:hypothetical protein